MSALAAAVPHAAGVSTGNHVGWFVGLVVGFVVVVIVVVVVAAILTSLSRIADRCQDAVAALDGSGTAPGELRRTSAAARSILESTRQSRRRLAG